MSLRRNRLGGVASLVAEGIQWWGQVRHSSDKRSIIANGTFTNSAKRGFKGKVLRGRRGKDGFGGERGGGLAKPSK